MSHKVEELYDCCHSHCCQSSAEEVFVVGDREKDRAQGRKKSGKKGGEMGGKKGMKGEINEVRQMERMEDICSNKMHNELKM